MMARSYDFSASTTEPMGKVCCSKLPCPGARPRFHQSDNATVASDADQAAGGEFIQPNRSAAIQSSVSAAPPVNATRCAIEVHHGDFRQAACMASANGTA